MPASTKPKKIPTFVNEQDEKEFWLEHDSADYVDWTRAIKVSMPDLKPSTKTISLRLPESLLADIKKLANKNDVPYQSLMKLFLAERVKSELA